MAEYYRKNGFLYSPDELLTGHKVTHYILQIFTSLKKIPQQFSLDNTDYCYFFENPESITLALQDLYKVWIGEDITVVIWKEKVIHLN